ncbi:MAG: DUF488 domain-containing protein [Solirubrobacterales bacterium]|nr:DUF488 domain-containing protein [Solirubrobacterales bacterium]
MAVFTIGHSTRELDEFVAILDRFGVGTLVDVRTVPRSRRVPQFNRDTLPAELERRNVTYRHLKKLGGLRHARKDSINGGWENSSFRGYADYMQTPDFIDGLNELITLAANATVAVMCAEAVPWRCHRRMIGDALIVRGFEVIDIFSGTKSEPETLTGFARVEGLQITYPESADTASSPQDRGRR